MDGRLRKADEKLIQITDAALADASRCAGEWLVCRPGCTQCCIGAFAINQLDAERLRDGLKQLERDDSTRAARVRERVRSYIERFSPDFPGDSRTGRLGEDEESQLRFEEFANDEPCPVLDPETGMCDLYAARPMTCRVFGPPIRSEGGIGACELCFHGATDREITACEMKVPSDEEEAVRRQFEKATGRNGETVVAWALTSKQ